MRTKAEVLEDILVASAATDMLRETLDGLTIEREGAFNTWLAIPKWRWIKKKRALKKLARVMESGDTVAGLLISSMRYIVELQKELDEFTT